jgi:benzoyl-CoA reductase/2-hydroxyglutaryl-CoA dehydratase subunit BcrC/BadD/HgdB
MKIFYSSPWVPVEWIEAHGLEPHGVWFAEDFGCGALPLSAGVCAFSEATLRFAETHRDSAMIFTTACDQMRRSFDTFAGSQPARACLFNLPATWQSPVALRIYRSELERLGRFLQAHGGRAPATEDLVKIIERRSQARKRLLESASRCSARQYAEAIARFHSDGSVSLPDHQPGLSSRAIPLAIVGGPLTAAQWSLLQTIEAAGARIVLNATESGERSLLPAFRLENVSDDPIDAVARGYFENIVDVFQRPNTRLYSWLDGRLTARGVRGIVLWVHTGCDLWRAEAQTLRETFRLPVLLLEADELSGGSPREANRIQAFVETFK